MLRIIWVLVILHVYKYCHGDLMKREEWKQHFYQPRRNYSKQIQNKTKNGQNPQSQVTFGLKLKTSIERHLNSTEASKGILNSLNQWRSNHSKYESNSRRVIQDSIENNFNQNAVRQNAIGLMASLHSFGTNINEKPKKMIYFRPRNNQNGKFGNSINTSYNPKENDKFQIEYNQESEIFPDCCSVSSNVLLVRNSGSKPVSNVHNSFNGPDYLPPLDKTTITYETPEYLPPTKRPYYPIKKITYRPFTTIPATISSTLATTTKKSYYIPIAKEKPATKQPAYNTRTFTSRPVYIPVIQPPTTLPTIFDSNTYKAEEYDPAKAMQVPAEEEDVTISIIPLPPINDQTEKGITREGGVELKATIPRNTTITFPPVGRVNERGDVPDEENSTAKQPTIIVPTAPEDQTSTTTTKEQTIHTSKIATSTLRMTLTTDPSTTTNKTVLTFENDRHLDNTFGPTTQINMKMTSFKAHEYLPPDDNTETTPVISTPPVLPAPAIAMPLPPEPEEAPILTPASITTAPTTVLENRCQTESDLPMKPFSGPEYLPPNTRRVPAMSGVAPALAMPVPPDPDDDDPTPATSMVPTDDFRAAGTPDTTAFVPTETNFKAPEYLPPKEVIPDPPSPAMAMPVTKDPGCDSNDTPNIDPRFSDTDAATDRSQLNHQFKDLHT